MPDVRPWKRMQTSKLNSDRSDLDHAFCLMFVVRSSVRMFMHVVGSVVCVFA